MLNVGLDVHPNRSSIRILNQDGKAVKQELIKGRWPQVIDRLRQIDQPFRVCYEASCGYGYLYDRISSLPMARQVLVAHPGQLRLIFKSKKKHDRVDAQKIAKLLYLDEVPAVHVPNVDVRSWRKLIEYRQKLLGKRVAAMNQVRAILRGNAVAAPKRLWTRKGMATLTRLELPSAEKLAMEMGLEEVKEFSQKIKRVEQELKKVADSHPGVTLLRTIPGVGIRTAEAFCAYVDDVKRFSSSRKVAAYFGLVPCLDSSAGKDRFGHITKDGPATVRKLLTEASWTAVKDPLIKERFDRIVKGDPDRRKIAIVAIAHYLCRVMASMLRSGEVWRGQKKKKQEQTKARTGCARRRRCSPPEDTAAGKCHCLLMVKQAAAVP